MFRELPVISGKTIDYLLCYFMVSSYNKAGEGDWDSVSIFMSILSNL